MNANFAALSARIRNGLVEARDALQASLAQAQDDAFVVCSATLWSRRAVFEREALKQYVLAPTCRPQVFTRERAAQQVTVFNRALRGSEAVRVMTEREWFAEQVAEAEKAIADFDAAQQ